MISLVKRSVSLFFFFSLVCWAQSVPSSTASVAVSGEPNLNQRIERSVRAHFRIPSSVGVTVGERRPSEFPGYDKITITINNNGHTNPYDFLLSKDGARLAQLNEIDVSKDPFSADGRPTRGAKDAKVTVVVYDDFQCPYCARGHRTLFSDIMPEYKDKILVVYMDFPLYEIHPWAIHAAVDANCLADQSNDAYWDFADYVHGNQEEIRGEKRPLAEQFSTLDHSALGYGKKFNADMGRLEACVKAQDEKAVRASIKYGGETLAVEATPTLFINGKKLDGAVPADELRRRLNAALREAGAGAPDNEPKAAAGHTNEEVGKAVAGAVPPNANDPSRVAPETSQAKPKQQ